MKYKIVMAIAINTIKMFFRHKISVALAFLAVMVTMTGAGTATVLTYDLTHSNVAELNNSVSVRVTTDTVAKTISVQLVSVPPTGFTPIGVDKFYYNIPNNDVIKVNELGWSTNLGGGQADGFGQFASLKSQSPAGNGGISNPIIFTLQNKFTVPISPNNHGGTIAVHVRFKEGCTGYISDGWVPQSSIISCTTTTQIPEFPTIALPVSAAIGIFFMVHRRRQTF